ncbi:MAG: M6 family metalloprotease domain-containing protein [Bacteroides sp.]|nr:M6 family metalloprotease domain-containing protein [Bacteroides sp.]
MNRSFTKISRLLALSALMGVASGAHAVTAKPGIITAMQPDGTTVNLRLEGNEYYNRAYTTDGYLLTVDDEGYYVFATIDAKGEPCASAFRADTPDTRSATTRSFLASFSQAQVVDAFNEKDSALRNPVIRRAPAKAGPGRFDATYPVSGEQRALVILVEFADNEFTSTDDPHSYFDRMLNEPDFSDNNATGSARDYFIVNSNGVFRPQFDVYGPVKLEKDMEYYGAHAAGANDRRPEKMITDACQLLDDEIDFSIYDCDANGVIDNVYVFYAGFGEASGGGNNTVWPHSAFLTDISKKKYYFDELLLDRYACSNELEVSGETVGIGTFVHEFSHVLGLPDIYSTGYTGAFTPGSWSCIDNGNYNNNGHTPPYYSSFERYALGWLEPTVIEEAGIYTLDRLYQTNEAFIVPTAREEEFFLFENRQQEGLDQFIPGHGMVVWHIDFNEEAWLKNTVNNDPSHQYVDLVEADNILNDRTRSGDSFPGSEGITEFTFETTPAFVSWDNVSPEFGLYDITETEDGIISFDLRMINTGIGQINSTSDALIIVKGNTVKATGNLTTIYDLSGRKLAVAGTQVITLEPGTYIASDGVKSCKFIIR